MFIACAVSYLTGNLTNRFTVIILLAIGSQRYFRMNTTGYHSDFNEFRRELEESALKFIQEAHKAPQSIYEQWQSFSHAVNWQQSWIRAILGFHIAAFVCVLATRKNVTIQTVSFFLLLFIVGSLEYVNEYCSKHWQSFADQNYFDKHGVFVGVMVATPTLLIATFQLVNFLILASDLLIKAKRLELAHKRRTKQQQSTDGAAGDVDTQIDSSSRSTSDESSLKIKKTQ